VGRDGLVDPGTLREPTQDPSGGVPVEAGAILACEQRAVGAFTDRSVDRSRGPWRERDERGLVALRK
jgi:hypothetical protein